MSDTLAAPSPIKFRWLIGLAFVLLVFVVIASYSSRIAQETGSYDRGRAAERYDTLAKLRADDQKTLSTADWVDQAKGTIRIPIDEALPETVAALQAKPVQAGDAIPGAVAAKPNVIPAAAQNEAPAGSPQASPSTNAAPAQPAPPASTAPNK
jgi:hypothetical protein